jgi:Dimerisation domain of Zinc Transporter
MPIPLLERSDRELAHRIRRRVRELPEVADCNDIQVGFTRKKPNIHFHVLLKQNHTFEETHPICAGIEMEVRSLVPNARLVIHSKPSGTDESKEVWKLVKSIAEAEPGSRGVQNIHLRGMDGKLGVDLRFQVSSSRTGKPTQELESHLGIKLKTADPSISETIIHQESVPDLVLSEQSGQGAELTSYIEHVARRFPEVVGLGPPLVRKMTDGLHVIDRVAFMPGISDAKLAEVTSKFSDAIRSGYPAIASAEIIADQRIHRRL